VRILCVALYHSRALDGSDVAVSGMFAVPRGRPPRGGFPVVALAHGSVPFDDRAAPSRSPVAGSDLDTFTSRGYAVAATDYEGVGTPGPEPTAIGACYADAVLDSVRALRRLAPHSISRRFAVAGHSEGGFAALWTGELARSYAPELELEAVASSAPGGDLPTLLRGVSETSPPRLKALLLVAAESWHEFYGAPLEPALTDAGIAAAQALYNNQPADLSVPLFRANALDIPASRELIEANNPGHVHTPAPILLDMGTADDGTTVGAELALVRRLRRLHDQLIVHLLQGFTHEGTAARQRYELPGFLLKYLSLGGQ
jgi:dipeptidyl aminopeptidase/acylaminoacyl peptidase